ncbi:MAG: hypothetical protein KGI75_16970, partial [Rhizobiaceae bacterium]|nr:hypothetical protein [Rhizobiaceae bacterium]
MKANRREFGKLGASAVLALSASPVIAQSTAAVAAAEPTAPDNSKFQYELDVPTDESAQKIFDELAYQRAVQVYLWGIPAVGMQQYRVANAKAMGDGPDDYKIGYLGGLLKNNIEHLT